MTDKIQMREIRTQVEERREDAGRRTNNCGKPQNRNSSSDLFVHEIKQKATTTTKKLSKMYCNFRVDSRFVSFHFVPLLLLPLLLLPRSMHVTPTECGQQCRASSIKYTFTFFLFFCFFFPAFCFSSRILQAKSNS